MGACCQKTVFLNGTRFDSVVCCAAECLLLLCESLLGTHTLSMFGRAPSCVQQVPDSTIELTEKQHSTGSIAHSVEDRSESGLNHQADGSREHHHEQVPPALASS